MTSKKPIWTKSFINNFIVTFFVFMTFYALLTLLPIYVLNELNGSATQAGLIVSMFLLSVILLRPFSGLILDKFGKKPMLLVSGFLFAFMMVGYIFVENTTGLLILRFFHGIPFSILTTVTGAIAADLIPQERRGEGIGYFGMAMNLAVVAGPFLALTLLPLTDYSTIFTVFGLLTLTGFICSLFIKGTKTSPVSRQKGKLTFNDLLERKSLPVAVVGLFVATVYSSIIAFISVYAESLGLIKAASFFFVVYAATMLLVRPFSGRLFDLKGPNIVIIPSLVFFALGMFLLSVTTASWMLLLSGVLVGLGYGTLLPSLQTLAIQAAPIHRSAYATATFFMFFDAGIATGSMILGVAAGLLGYAPLYAVLGVAVLLIIGMYWRIVGKTRSLA